MANRATASAWGWWHIVPQALSDAQSRLVAPYATAVTTHHYNVAQYATLPLNPRRWLAPTDDDQWAWF